MKKIKVETSNRQRTDPRNARGPETCSAEATRKRQPSRFSPLPVVETPDERGQQTCLKHQPRRSRCQARDRCGRRCGSVVDIGRMCGERSTNLRPWIILSSYWTQQLHCHSGKYSEQADDCGPEAGGGCKPRHTVLTTPMKR